MVARQSRRRIQVVGRLLDVASRDVGRFLRAYRLVRRPACFQISTDLRLVSARHMDAEAGVTGCSLRSACGGHKLRGIGKIADEEFVSGKTWWRKRDLTAMQAGIRAHF